MAFGPVQDKSQEHMEQQRKRRACFETPTRGERMNMEIEDYGAPAAGRVGALGMRRTRTRRRRRYVPKVVRRKRQKFRKGVRSVVRKMLESHTLKFSVPQTNYPIICANNYLRNGCALYGSVLPSVNMNTVVSNVATGIAAGSGYASYIGRKAYFTALRLEMRLSLPAPETTGNWSRASNWMVGYKIIRASRKAVADDEVAQPNTDVKEKLSMTPFGEPNLVTVAVTGPPAVAVTTFPAESGLNDGIKSTSPRAFVIKYLAVTGMQGTGTPPTWKYEEVFGPSNPQAVNPWKGAWSKDYRTLKEGYLAWPYDAHNNAIQLARLSEPKIITLPLKKTWLTTDDPQNLTNLWDFLMPDTYVLVWCFNPAVPIQGKDTADADMANVNPILTLRSQLYWKAD